MGVTKPSKTGKVCANCGCPQEQWTSQSGYESKYCCEGCASGSGCTCGDADTNKPGKSSSVRGQPRREFDDSE
jgi:hypothetical protein